MSGDSEDENKRRAYKWGSDRNEKSNRNHKKMGRTKEAMEISNFRGKTI